jgi:hypothetical protein
MSATKFAKLLLFYLFGVFTVGYEFLEKISIIADLGGGVTLCMLAYGGLQLEKCQRLLDVPVMGADLA